MSTVNTCKPSVLGAMVLLVAGVVQLGIVGLCLFVIHLWFVHQRSDNAPKGMGLTVSMFAVVTTLQCTLYILWLKYWGRCSFMAGFTVYFVGTVVSLFIFGALFPCEECQVINRLELNKTTGQ
jgi:hypothetical protein